MFAFDLEKFLIVFPEFNTADAAAVHAAGVRARFHIKRFITGLPMSGEDREYARFLAAAHIIALDKNDNSSGDGSSVGGIAGTPFKATVGSVTIENTKPNSFESDDWNYWYNQTKYGRELLALLDIQAPAGVFLNNQSDSVRDLV